MAETEKRDLGGGNRSRWIVAGLCLVAGAAAAYYLVQQLTVSGERLAQAELEAAAAGDPVAVALIPVEGMSCAACAARVRKTLLTIDGVLSAEVSLTERNVKVRYLENGPMPEDFVAAINGLGYTARSPVASDNEAPSAGTPAGRRSPAEATHITIPVNGMACEGCAKRVEDHLAAMDGVIDVRVSVSENAAQIRFAPDKVSSTRITEAIDSLGFTAGSAVGEDNE